MDHIKNKKLGQQGEQLIADKLQAEGYKIIARNYLKRAGEIDIIAQKDDLVAFVEVKTRYNPLFDSAEIIDPIKQKKIMIVAKQYLAEHNVHDLYCRFDVALVEHSHGTQTVTYIFDAFGE